MRRPGELLSRRRRRLRSDLTGSAARLGDADRQEIRLDEQDRPVAARWQSGSPQQPRRRRHGGVTGA
jgi:hypothetical protein